MKKLFNHTKKSQEEWDDYDANDYDWDMPEESEQEETEVYFQEADEYYAEDAVEYYTEDAETVYSEEEEYYEEGVEEYYTQENGEYYAEEEESYYQEAEYGQEEGVKEYCAEESEEYYTEQETEYYAEENAEYYADEGEEYYEPEAYYESEEYYEEETYAEKEQVRAELLGTPSRKKKQDNVFLFLWTKFMEMAIMDRIITSTGIAVLILALVTGGLYISSKADDESVAALADVGIQLEGIDLIGEHGLMAVADAEMARLAAAELVEEQEEQKEYDEEEYSSAVTVKLNMTSVMKDLKIKFTNKDTGKLISNVPFSVTITKPDGKSETWSDDDMDGIIYQKNLKDGTYEVLINELTGEQYEKYIIPTIAQSVEVKKDIAYEKIDVSDEVKTEDEIDVSQEDTQINDIEVESTLQDTVTWVESTEVAETYTEVSKSTIPDPATLAMTGSFLRMAAAMPAVSDGDMGNKAFQATVSPTNVNVAMGGSVVARITPTGYTSGAELVYKNPTSSNSAVATATVDANGNITITGVSTGTATVAVTVDYKQGTSLPVNVYVGVTVSDRATITLDKTATTVYVTEPVVINATLANAPADAVIQAESSNTNVATVSVNGMQVTITGVAEGDATITVKYVQNGQEVQGTCVVRVKNHPRNNNTDKLKDANGKQLYVLENEQYREAVYADYYTATKFFIKGDVKYTGWQTIDGIVYYFDATGQKVTGEQVIQGVTYNFASDGSLVTSSGTLGIDVSKWNGNIDWQAVKNSGVSYVIIRCGYRGSTQGMLIEDPKFTANIRGATAAGLKVGVYFFSQATDEIEAVEEASYVLDKIKNYRISYPVFLDVEPSGGRGDRIDKTTRTAVCKAFCETIQRAGYTAGIYANKTWLNEKINTRELSAYKIWLAQYAATPTYTGRYDMWQYKSTGRVSGISGDVDMNLSYLGY